MKTTLHGGHIHSPHIHAPGSRLSKRVGMPKGLTMKSPGSMAHMTAPHNRLKKTSTIPAGGHMRGSSGGMHKLGKQMSVKDVLDFKFPKM